jgi:hypothetical protein
MALRALPCARCCVQPRPARVHARAALARPAPARVLLHRFTLRATPPEQSAAEEDSEAESDAAELETAGGDSTRAGAGMILARAGGVESQVSPKALEVNAAVADLTDLAEAERELLQRAQALLKTLGVVAPPLAPPDDDDDESDGDGEEDGGAVPGI